MIAAVCAAAVVWLTVPVSATTRAGSLWPSQRSRRRIDMSVLAAVLTPVAGLVVVGWPWGFLIGLMCAGLVRDRVRLAQTSAERRRAERVRAQVPAALDLVAAAMESGRPPADALRIVAAASAPPLAEDLSLCADRLAVAADARTALAQVPAGLELLARALRRAEDSGAPVASVVATAADDARREARADRRESARRVGVRTAVPLGLCFLPAFLLVGIVPTLISIAGSISLW